MLDTKSCVAHSMQTCSWEKYKVLQLYMLWEISSNKCILVGTVGAMIVGICLLHDEVMKWKHFPRYWSPVHSLTKARDAVKQTIETQMILQAISLIMMSL